MQNASECEAASIVVRNSPYNVWLYSGLLILQIYAIKMVFPLTLFNYFEYCGFTLYVILNRYMY